MRELGWDYPLHLGVTEAGNALEGRVWDRHRHRRAASRWHRRHYQSVINRSRRWQKFPLGKALVRAGKFSTGSYWQME